MKIYTCNKFTGRYPVGVGAVVSAQTQEQAAFLLNKRLQKKHGLSGNAKPEDMVEFSGPFNVVVLCYGDY